MEFYVVIQLFIVKLKRVIAEKWIFAKTESLPTTMTVRDGYGTSS